MQNVMFCWGLVALDLWHTLAVRGLQFGQGKAPSFPRLMKVCSVEEGGELKFPSQSASCL